MGLDQHRAQITADRRDTATGEVKRGSGCARVIGLCAPDRTPFVGPPRVRGWWM